ncbi:MAG: hypothetical protein ACKO0Z_15045 [Betaproteobacteria bacterium]
MASEVPREKSIGLFKPSPEQRMKSKRQKVNFRDKRPGMSDDHLACIRKLPCCTCLKMPGGQVSHIKDTPDKERGMGLKSSDKWAVPQCNDCHINGVERVGTRNELAWFKTRGVDALSLASALWHSTGDIPKMTRIVIEHHGGKS